MKDSEHFFIEKLNKSKNVLLMKSEIGRSRKFTCDLPPENHSYGLIKKTDSEGVGMIISSWSIHKPTVGPSPQKDYRKLNKLGVINKITKPKQVKDFRDQYMCLVKSSKGKITANKPLNESVVHGVPNRPSTPIYKLVQNEYGNQASIDSHNQYLQESTKKSVESSRKNMRSASPNLRSNIKNLSLKKTANGKSNSKL